MISKLSKFYFNSLYPKLCCSVPDFFHSCINHKMSRAESIIQTNKNGFSKPMLASCAWMPLCKSSRNLSNIWARTLKIHHLIKNRYGMKVSGTKGKLLGNLELKQCASCFRVDGNFCHAVKFTKNYGIFWSCKVMENYCLNPPKAIGFILGTKVSQSTSFYLDIIWDNVLFNNFENPQLRCLFNVAIFYRLSFIYYIYWQFAFYCSNLKIVPLYICWRLATFCPC